MRGSIALSLVALCAASIGVAYAQQAVKSTTSTKPVPSGMTFSFDPQQGQIVATGVQLAPSSAKPSVTSPTTGTVTVTLNIKPVSKFPRGTEYPCSVFLVGGQLDLSNGTVQGGLETSNGTAKYSGGVYVCTLTIPYSWTLDSDPTGETGLIIAFAAGAQNPQGHYYRSTLQLDGIENLPATGTTSSYTFDLTL
jgi:hypothetical protein